MALTVETGVGVAGADSYASEAAITAYWVARPHRSLADDWAAATTAEREGAAREATGFIDATWGPYMRGVRRGWVQGLCSPRTDAYDDTGYPLPDHPDCLVWATAELAARALSAPLAADIDAGARIKREKVGPLETEYFDAGVNAPAVSYGAVGAMLAPILNGSQPDAPGAHWAWA